MKLKTLELFSGYGSFSEVAIKREHIICRIEKDKYFLAEYYKDIIKLDINFILNEINYIPTVLWASPPCTTFSIASVRYHWDKITRKPKSKKSIEGLKLLDNTIKIISNTLIKNNKLIWFIENPRGIMRKIIDDIFKKYNISDYKRFTITYCQYGDNRMKPTDIWTNLKEWKPKPMCKNGDKCHISAPRGSKTGTQGLKNSKERSRIPLKLFDELFDCIEMRFK